MRPLLFLLAGAPPAITTPPQVPSAEALDPTDEPATARSIDAGYTPTGLDLGARIRPKALGDKILYVNYDGADMQFCGNDDPSGNCSTIFTGNVLPYSGDAVKRASVIQSVRKRVADFGITVTDQRPNAGDYDMEMVGDWEGENPSFAGIAPNIDCWDNDGGEVSFTLEAAGTADGTAEIILQELAHTWGLEHVDEQQDLLYPTTQGTNKTFRDECYQIVQDTDLNPSGGICNSVHTNFCNSGRQNSYQEMLLVFGVSTPDAIAPSIEIIAPADGETVDGSEGFELEVALNDDQSPAIIDTMITIDGDALAMPLSDHGAYAAPIELKFPIKDLPDGTYTIGVAIADESDNPASDQITITVVGNPANGDSGDEGGSGDGGEGGDGTGGDGGGADGADSADAESDGGDGPGGGDGNGDGGDTDGGLAPTADEGTQGCACTSESPAHGLGLLAPLLIFVRNPRRRHRSAT